MNCKKTYIAITGASLIAIFVATVPMEVCADKQGVKLVKLVTGAPEYFDDKGKFQGVLNKKEVMDIKRALPLSVLRYKEKEGLCLIHIGKSKKWVSEVDFIVKGEVKSLKCAKVGKVEVNHGAMGAGKGCR